MKIVLISDHIFGKFIITATFYIYLNPDATVSISRHIETTTHYLSNLSFLLSWYQPYCYYSVHASCNFSTRCFTLVTFEFTVFTNLQLLKARYFYPYNANFRILSIPCIKPPTTRFRSIDPAASQRQ